MSFLLLGTAQSWFNTFNTSSAVKTTLVSWPTDGSFHALKAVLRRISGDTKNLAIDYYMDNSLKATHVAANFYGKSMWL